MAAKPLRPPTPQGISALLKKAGHDRVTFSKSRIRGLREYSAGFRATKPIGYPDGTVEVQWWPSSFSHSPQTEQRVAWLARYAEAITAAGWAVDRSRPDKLIVTLPKP